MRGKELQQKLRAGEKVYGSHIVGIINPLIPEMYARSGLDFAFICNEHMPLDRSETSLMCKMYASNGVSPMVRIPYPDARLATIAIDGGAEGIVAPYVESPDEVREIIAALKYRPIKGKKLEDICAGREVPGKKLTDFLEKFNEDLYLVVGIESVYAIENLESIISVDGVSCVFLGPHDITCSMGIPVEYSNPDFIKVIVDVVKRCRRLNVGVGIHTNLNNPAFKPFFDAGMNFLLDASDIVGAIDNFKRNSELFKAESDANNIKQHYSTTHDV